MNDLWERIETKDGEPALRAGGGVSIAEIVRRLEGGDRLSAVARSLTLEPIDLVAVLASAGLGAEGESGPPLVQSNPRHPRLLDSLSVDAWAELLPRANRTSVLALAAGLLQIHDFWNASHEAAQEADDLGERQFSAYWHGIAHRREPDAGNASYWFRRVGPHSAFARLADAAKPVLEASGDSALASQLIPGGSWNAFAFIDACCRTRPGAPAEKILRALQRLEMKILLDATLVPLV